MQSKPDSTRRTLIKGLAVAPIAGAFLYHGVALAARLEEGDPQASALAYKQASTVDGKSCANCKFWKSGTAAWGECTIFPGKEVASGGHCKSWAAP